MNLYLRLIWTLIRAWRQPRIASTDTLERQFRVLPNDIDINQHMNNGRYLTLIDLMLIEYFVRIGFAQVLLKNKWRPMAGGSVITYRRALQPFKQYTLRFKSDGRNEHWNFMRFEFVADGKVCATGYMKGAAVSKAGLVSTNLAYEKMNAVPPETFVPIVVQNWLAAEQSMVSTPW